MHPFPHASELNFLVGEEIGQISLDPWSLQFRFVSGAHITVEGRIEHIDETGRSHHHDCQVRAGEALYLHQLLQQSISAVEVEPLCLSLKFTSGSILRIFSELSQYECGQIYPAGSTALVMIVF